MPEGDTLFKAAARLRVMVGQVVTRFVAPALDAVDPTGRTISDVEARGKNLLMWFDGTHALYTHLRMSGSWHLHRPGEGWRKPTHGARAVVETAEWAAICFHAPVVEWLTAWEVTHHPVLARLGPDLLGSEDADATIEAAVERLRAEPGRPLGEAVLDQRAVAGLGNVYKSELLFLERLDPFAPVGSYDAATLRRLLAAGRTWMRRNVGDGPRRTRWTPGAGNTWVYGRVNEPCARCGEPIAMRRQGAAGRSTYYCPRCQRGQAAPRGRVMVRGAAR